MEEDLLRFHMSPHMIPAYGGFAPNVVVLADFKRPYKAIVPGLFIMGEE